MVVDGKHSAGFLVEVSRFARIMDSPARTGQSRHTAAGLAQFHAYESRGVKPAEPDSYYTLLWNGKRWWEWTLNYYADAFGTPDWHGWEQYRKDFAGDQRGYDQMRARVCQRFPGLPSLSDDWEATSRVYDRPQKEATTS